MADVNLQPALEAIMGQLLFRATSLQAQNEQLRAELAKVKQPEAKPGEVKVLPPNDVGGIVKSGV